METKKIIAENVKTALRIVKMNETPDWQQKTADLAGALTATWLKNQFIDNRIIQAIEDAVDEKGFPAEPMNFQVDADGWFTDGDDIYATFTGTAKVVGFQHNNADIYAKGLHYRTIEPESTEFTVEYSGSIVYQRGNDTWYRPFNGSFDRVY